MSRLPTGLVEGHAYVVHQEATRFHVSRIEIQDLHQAGLLGLLLAAARFDENRGPFSAYARHWVRKEMQRAVGGSEFSTVVPADYVGRVVALRRLAEDTSGVADLARRVQLSEAVTAALLGALSVEMPPGEVPHPTGVPADEIAIGNVLAEALRAAIADLPTNERSVVVDHFGIADGEPKSARAVSRRLGISPSTVRSRLQRSLDLLRVALQSISLQEGTNPLTTSATRAIEWPNYGFAIEIPSGWDVFPGDGSNGSVAQLRSRAARLSLALNIWKLPNEGATPDQFAKSVQQSLETGGYQNFEITRVDGPAGFECRRLAASREDGWTTIQHYLSRGPAVYAIGWGTQDPQADQSTIDTVTDTFQVIN